MIEDTKDLVREGLNAYKQGRYAEAALFYARARRTSEELRDYHGAFEAGVWEVESLRLVGRYEQAMNLLVTLQPPAGAPPAGRWVAQKKIFDITASTHPSLSRLRQALDDISALATRLPHPSHDVDMLQGNLYEFQGEWLRALEHYERAWSRYGGKGYLLSDSAYGAALMALRLHRFGDAQAWRSHLAETEQVEWAGARQQLKEVNAHFALYTGDRAALLESLEAGCGRNDLETRVRIMLRGRSCDPRDDPSERFHPTRALLRKRPERSKDVHDRYTYRLTVVDYHLASLRFAAGGAAIEDYYYQLVDLPPCAKIGDPQGFAKRLRAFDRAYSRLERHARWLDGLLQCDYRTKEATCRHERRDAISKGAVQAAAK
jgi:tetratricopeptide (TPR) repeat protein